MATGTSATIDTITALRAFSGAITAPYNFDVQGYSAIDDGGGGEFIYVAGGGSDNGLTIIVDGAGRAWKRQYRDRINVLWAGADSTGAADSSAAFNACAAFCIANKLSMYIPTGTYTITKSINCTSATYPQNFYVTGDGQQQTVVNANLTEAYAVFDMTGNAHGGILGMSVISQGGMEKCALLQAQLSTGGASGNTQFCLDFLTDGPFSVAGVVACVDQWVADGLPGGTSTFKSTVAPGLWVGDQLPAITSKFQSIGNGGLTTIYLNRLNIISYSTSSPALRVAGLAGHGFRVDGKNLYLTATGASAPQGIYITNSGAIELNWDGYRYEYNGSGTAHIGFEWDNGCPRGRLVGDCLPSGSSGIYGAAYQSDAGYLTDLHVKGTTGQAASVFGAGTVVLGGEYRLQVTSTCALGVVSGSSYGYELDIFGAGDLSGLTAWALAFKTATKIFGEGGLLYDSLRRYPVNPVGISPGVTAPVKQRYVTAVRGGTVTTSANTPGTLTQVASFSVDPSVLLAPDGNGNITLPIGELSIMGFVGSTAAAGGNVQITLTQGTNTASVMNMTGINAYSGASQGLWIGLRLWDQANNGLGSIPRALCTAMIGLQSYSYLTGLGSFTWSGGIITLALLVNNSGSNPYTFNYWGMKI